MRVDNKVLLRLGLGVRRPTDPNTVPCRVPKTIEEARNQNSDAALLGLAGQTAHAHRSRTGSKPPRQDSSTS